MKKALHIQSMTGFAQGSGSLSDFTWVWETKSLNSKGLDIRIRLPNGFSELEVLLFAGLCSALFTLIGEFSIPLYRDWRPNWSERASPP